MPKLMDEDTVLLINNCFYYIDSIICDDLSSGLITISGSLFLQNRVRIVYQFTIKQKTRADLLRSFTERSGLSVRCKKKNKFLSVEQPAAITSSNISYQNSYGNVEEEIEDCVKVTILVLRNSYLEWAYWFNIKRPSWNINIRFRKSEDVSSVVQFSAEFENVTNESLEKNNYDEATTALIYGEGEGKARKHTQVNNNLSGLERKEIYVDARDLQQTVDDVKCQMHNILPHCNQEEKKN